MRDGKLTLLGLGHDQLVPVDGQRHGDVDPAVPPAGRGRDAGLGVGRGRRGEGRHLFLHSLNSAELLVFRSVSLWVAYDTRRPLRP